jgi:branched-chain amino acid transport system substrate-binding protein
MKAKYWLFSCIALVFVILLVVEAKKAFFDETLYIAVVGPMANANGKGMVQGVRLYLDKINYRIDGKRVKLLEYDDQNDKGKAAKIAKKIAKENNALLVIGHYASNASLAVAPIYKEHRIAAITGTATNDDITKDNDWYFRVIFNNSDQGAVLANYVHKILGYKKAYVFYDEDKYGQTLKEAFIQTAERIGLKIEKQWGFTSSNKDPNKAANFEDRLDEIINADEMKGLAKGQEEDQDKKELGILFLATHSTEAVKAIKSLLLRLETQIPMIGGDALTSSNFTKMFKAEPQEQVSPGSYTDGIHVVSPFLIDMAGKHAQRFREAFVKTYPPKKGEEELLDSNLTTAALYYDAAMVAVNAIEKMLADDEVNQASLPEKREGVQKQLLQLSSIENALDGVTGELYFDKNGDAVKLVPIGRYEKGKPIVAWFQYQPLSSLQTIDNLVQEILDNQIIQVNDKFMQQTHVVYVGVDFNDIRELDIDEMTYSADFYLWFRFQRDCHAQGQVDSINFVNIFKPEDNKLDNKIYPLDDNSTIPKKDEGQAHYQRGDNNPEVCKGTSEEKPLTKTYRVKALFKVDFDLQDYPLDKQILPIQFRHNNLTTKELIYVVDRQGMGIDNLSPGETMAERMDLKPEGLKPDVFSVGGEWQVSQVSFFQGSQRNDSTLGIPEQFESEQRIEYSRFNAELEIGRDVWSFILKNLLTVIFVIGLGYAVYYTDVFAVKMTLSVNLILSTSLFHLKLASAELASVGYNVLIENVFYVVYLLALAGIVASLFFNTKKKETSIMEGKLDKMKDQLDKMKENPEKMAADVSKAAVKEAEIKETEGKISKLNGAIKSIDVWGRIIYPVVLFVAILIIFYEHLF